MLNFSPYTFYFFYCFVEINWIVCGRNSIVNQYELHHTRIGKSRYFHKTDLPIVCYNNSFSTWQRIGNNYSVINWTVVNKP